MDIKIVGKISEGKFDSTKNLLKTLKGSSNNIDIKAVRYGTLGEDKLISFNIDDKNVNLVVDNLISMGVKILFPEQFAKKKEIKVILDNQSTSKDSVNSIAEKKATGKESPSALLDLSIKNGDYESVIQLSKDVRLNVDVLDKAKNSIDVTIQIAIDKAYNRGMTSMFEIDSAVDQLIKIASDKNLKVLNRLPLQKMAGIKAVELCGSHVDQTNNLIRICNNNLLPYIVCIKAATKFIAIFENNHDNAEEEILYATKNLNIRWINIALDIIKPELADDELQEVNNLISMVQQRQAKKVF